MSQTFKFESALLAVSSNGSVSELLAVSTIQEFYSEQGKKIKFLLPENADSRKVLTKLGHKESDFASEIPAPEFEISLKTQNSEVDKVQWQQEKDVAKIYLKLTKGMVTPNDLRINRIGERYDQIVLPSSELLNAAADKSNTNENNDYLGDTKKLISDKANTEKFTVIGMKNEEEYLNSLNINKDQIHKSYSESYKQYAEYAWAHVANTTDKSILEKIVASLMLSTANLTDDQVTPNGMSMLTKLLDQGVQPGVVKKYTKTED